MATGDEDTILQPFRFEPESGGPKPGCESPSAAPQWEHWEHWELELAQQQHPSTLLSQRLEDRGLSVGLLLTPPPPIPHGVLRGAAVSERCDPGRSADNMTSNIRYKSRIPVKTGEEDDDEEDADDAVFIRVALIASCFCVSGRRCTSLHLRLLLLLLSFLLILLIHRNGQQRTTRR
ncbi:unnamed protein product [Pleuronectes platessa]|uniref:Uncharacterized protein n=1 Tax=Pleuronectes platessa TaxID=8262 RepID=A0A9N7Z2C4_PLEPL|nr:unnamed protein product [Pleuronectes platessa]